MFIHDQVTRLYTDNIRTQDEKVLEEKDKLWYTRTQNINIPISLPYAEKVFDVFHQGYKCEDFLLKDKPLFTALTPFLDILRKTAHLDYFILRRLESVEGSEEPQCFIQMLVHGDALVKIKGKSKKIPLVETKEFLELVKAGHAYDSELFSCVELETRYQFLDVIRSLIYSHCWIEDGQSGEWPFYGWSNHWVK